MGKYRANVLAGLNVGDRDWCDHPSLHKIECSGGSRRRLCAYCQGERSLRGVGCIVHALKSALIPIITAIGIWTAFLVSGTVILEEVFAIPGLGRLVLSAIENRDYPMIQGTVLFLSLGVALVMLIADLLVALVDPRVKL